MGKLSLVFDLMSWDVFHVICIVLCPPFLFTVFFSALFLYLVFSRAQRNAIHRLWHFWVKSSWCLSLRKDASDFEKWKVVAARVLGKTKRGPCLGTLNSYFLELTEPEWGEGWPLHIFSPGTAPSFLLCPQGTYLGSQIKELPRLPCDFNVEVDI